MVRYDDARVFAAVGQALGPSLEAAGFRLDGVRHGCNMMAALRYRTGDLGLVVLGSYDGIDCLDASFVKLTPPVLATDDFMWCPAASVEIGHYHAQPGRDSESDFTADAVQWALRTIAPALAHLDRARAALEGWPIHADWLTREQNGED
ncbi:MAG TPA: hypothetical protein VD997_11905 [Phycisphaerales bacterium]|nr:hypothetical protein [Phycisphaerales bacterium]